MTVVNLDSNVPNRVKKNSLQVILSVMNLSLTSLRIQTKTPSIFHDPLTILHPPHKR